MEELCTLPERFDQTEGSSVALVEQAAMIMACHTINTTEYTKCALRHRRLVEWSNKVVTREDP